MAILERSIGEFFLPPNIERARQHSILETKNLSAWYGNNRVFADLNISIPQNAITAIIGPSGCGKSTLLRIFNRLHEVTPSARVSGAVFLEGENIYDHYVDAVRVRQQIGLVFQKPNPFPTMSIEDNVLAGIKLIGLPKGQAKEEVVETALKQATLWEEVKDRLKQSGSSLSGGQQQRLCIARALAIKPRVLLMDEPCSALDPTATQKIENLIAKLKDEVTIVIVTHNIEQARRASDFIAFFYAQPNQHAQLIEFGETHTISLRPRETLTEDFMGGKFG